METSLKPQVPVEGTLFLFDSEAQGQLYIQVRDRLGEDDVELYAKFGEKMLGWRVLDRLIARQREEQLKNMQERPPSKAQVRKLTLYKVAAGEQGLTFLYDQTEKVLQDFSANMDTFSRALDVMERHIVLTPVEEALGRFGETAVEEEPF